MVDINLWDAKSMHMVQNTPSPQKKKKQEVTIEENENAERIIR